MDDIDDIKPHYEQLGTYLRVREPDIQAIKNENQQDVWICLNRVINLWLNRNTIGSEEPNMILLVNSIRRINPQLAITLEEKYNMRG